VSRKLLRAAPALLLAAVILVGLLRILIDRDPLTGDLGLAWPEAAWRGLRLTAAATSLLAGAMLGLAGMLLQAALRNPLASPSVLGVSSGAGLGVMLALYVTHQSGMGDVPWGVPALVGAAAAVIIVVLLGRRDGWPDPVSTVLAGVIVATMCGAGMVLLQGLVPDGLRGRFLAWALGTVPEFVPRGAISAMVAVLAAGVAWGILNHGRLDALLLDHASGEAIGARPGAARMWCLVLAGVLTAITVAICGPLGFVGLVAPHVARLMVGPAHRMLLPASVLCGAVLVCGADVLRQLIDVGTGRLPVGVLTTLGGGPLFLWLLRRGAGSDWTGGRHSAAV